MTFIDVFKKFNIDYDLGTDTWLYPKYATSVIIPTQGFKLHITATINNAEEILENSIVYLSENKIPFKVAQNIKVLEKLNAGLLGFSQIGKLLTIYPINDEEAVNIANELDKKLTEFSGPKIPSDKQLHDKSSIYYRYGQFVQTTYNDKLISINGTFIEDVRKASNAVPDYISDPFNNKRKHTKEKNPLFNNDYLIIGCLRQRAKGGVYKGLNFKKFKEKKEKPSPVIIKEARYLSVVDEYNVDFRSRLKSEYRLLKYINEKEEKIVPKVYDFFELDRNLYLVMEQLEGNSLLEILKEKIFSSEELLRLGAKISEKISFFHDNDIVINDLSLDNIMILPNEELRIIDLEFCYQQDSNIANSLVGYGTPGFYPKENQYKKPEKSRDFYALGAILYALKEPEWYLKTLEKGNFDSFWERLHHQNGEQNTKNDFILCNFIKLCLSCNNELNFNKNINEINKIIRGN